MRSTYKQFYYINRGRVKADFTYGDMIKMVYTFYAAE